MKKPRPAPVEPRWPEAMRAGTVGRYFDCARATIYRIAAADPTFPKPIRRGSRYTAWRKAEIDEWLKSQT